MRNKTTRTDPIILSVLSSVHFRCPQSLHTIFLLSILSNGQVLRRYVPSWAGRNQFFLLQRIWMFVSGENAMSLVRRAVGLAVMLILLLLVFGGGWLVGRLGIG